jgi:hypothetical protein
MKISFFRNSPQVLCPHLPISAVRTIVFPKSEEGTGMIQANEDRKIARMTCRLRTRYCWTTARKLHAIG